MSLRQPSFIEPLEGRTLLASTPTPGNFVISFYGLGGAGGFGNDWMDNLTKAAGKPTNSTVRKYDEDQGGRALKDLFRSADRNHDKIITASEAKRLNLRVVGYSFGGIQAANFAAELNQVGSTIKGYRLDGGVPIRSLVALDPVNSSPLKHTDGVPSNVQHFSNYYQRHGGETTVQLYLHPWPHTKLTTIDVPDPTNIIGDQLATKAHLSKQLRVDVGTFADQSVKHEVYSEVDGKLKGSDVNHGTLPFFAYDWAVKDLTA